MSCNVYKPNRSCEAGHSKKGALCRLVDETCNGCGGVAWFTEISGGSQIVKDSRVATNDEADQVAPFFSVSRARGCYDEANDVAEARRLVFADS